MPGKALLRRLQLATFLSQDGGRRLALLWSRGRNEAEDSGSNQSAAMSAVHTSLHPALSIISIIIIIITSVIVISQSEKSSAPKGLGNSAERLVTCLALIRE